MNYKNIVEIPLNITVNEKLYNGQSVEVIYNFLKVSSNSSILFVTMKLFDIPIPLQIRNMPHYSDDVFKIPLLMSATNITDLMIEENEKRLCEMKQQPCKDESCDGMLMPLREDAPHIAQYCLKCNRVFE